MLNQIHHLLITTFLLYGLIFCNEKPNIILIMTDDMGRECIESHGGLSYKTPHLNGLASQGLQFNHCYSQPLCTPSRVKIMTGKYNFRNYQGFGILPPSEFTFGNLLKKAGYRTCIAGKWQLGGDHHQILKFGFDEYCLINGVRPIDGKVHDRGKERYWGYPAIVANGKLYESSKKYGPDMINEYAVNFIKAQKNQPFFLYYPMVLPHSPWAPTPHSKSGDKSGKKVCEVRFFKDNIEYIDHLVGNVVKALVQSEQRDNTLILFTSDNGTGYSTGVTSPSESIDRVVSKSGDKHDEIFRKAGEKTPRLKGKFDYMEGPISKTTYGSIPGQKNKMTRDGTGVPLIIDWPKYNTEYQKLGHQLNDLVDFSDFFATFAELAQVKSNQPFDGISFASRLKGGMANSRNYVFCHYWHFGRDPKGAQDSIHDGHYKLYNDGRFYDLNKDPEESSPLTKNNMLERDIHARAQLLKDYADLRGSVIPTDNVSPNNVVSTLKKQKKKAKK